MNVFNTDSIIKKIYNHITLNTIRVYHQFYKSSWLLTYLYFAVLEVVNRSMKNK